MSRRSSDHSVGNRFEAVRLDVADLNSTDVDASDPEDVFGGETKTEVIDDYSRSIVAQNDSPDIGFNFSINPYRGCEHGCAYCYARPSHEYLGYDAGLDFESKILVKRDAARLFRKWLNRPAWHVEPIAMSGVTDPYQPLERRFGLTREILEVAWNMRQPMSVITKNALITRDIDLLGPMASRDLVRTAVSVTTLDAKLARHMEPRTSTPAARLRAIEELTNAGVPVRVMVAPIIPGLNDSEIPQILEAAANAGATSAGHVMLRLPLTVEPIFRRWLRREEPLRAEKVEAAVRGTRNDKMYDPTWGQRQTGTGFRAEQIAQTFGVFAKRFGLSKEMPSLRTDLFRPDREAGQLSLFNDGT